MSLFTNSKRFFTIFFVFSFFMIGIQNIADAAIVDSSDIVSDRQTQSDRQQLKSWMARAEVRDQLVDLGVDVDAAIVRVDSMTDSEIQLLASKMDEMPAAGGFVEVAVLAFLVLVILEVSGVTDILPNI